MGIPGGGERGTRVTRVFVAWILGLRVGLLGGNPRMARGYGTPRGRRVGTSGLKSTHGAWVWRAAWTPRGIYAQVPL